MKTYRFFDHNGHPYQRPQDEAPFEIESGMRSTPNLVIPVLIAGHFAALEFRRFYETDYEVGYVARIGGAL